MNGSGFHIKGVEELQKAIVEAYSGAKARQIKKEALDAGGEVVANQLRQNFEAFKDTGYSKDEIMKTDAKSRNNVEELKIGWRGEHERWRLVHLNEFGYNKKGKQYTPKGFGAISKTIQESKEDYFNTVAGRLKESL